MGGLLDTWNLWIFLLGILKSLFKFLLRTQRQYFFREYGEGREGIFRRGRVWVCFEAIGWVCQVIRGTEGKATGPEESGQVG